MGFCVPPHGSSQQTPELVGWGGVCTTSLKKKKAKSYSIGMHACSLYNSQEGVLTYVHREAL